MATEIERSPVGEAVDASFAAHLVLDPLNEEPRERRLEASEWLVKGIMQRPKTAETMLWPVLHSALLEEDLEIAEHSLKALQLIHHRDPELVSAAVPLVADRFDPDILSRSAEEILENLRAETYHLNRRVGGIFLDGLLDMRRWARAEFVTEVVQAKGRQTGFRDFQERDPAGASLVLEREMDRAQDLYDWLGQYEGVVPRRWEKSKFILEDLRQTRGLGLPGALLDAAMHHPQAKVAKTAVNNHILSSTQKAELERRGDIPLKPTSETFFARRENQIRLEALAARAYQN